MTGFQMHSYALSDDTLLSRRLRRLHKPLLRGCLLFLRVFPASLAMQYFREVADQQLFRRSTSIAVCVRRKSQMHFMTTKKARLAALPYLYSVPGALAASAVRFYCWNEPVCDGPRCCREVSVDVLEDSDDVLVGLLAGSSAFSRAQLAQLVV